MFTAIAHFTFTKEMTLMIQEFIPFKMEAVYLTGVIEIAFAIRPSLFELSGFGGLAIYCFSDIDASGNIYASMKNVDYQKGTFDGNGLRYLWFRVPLQILFIVWTYLSAVRC